MRRAITVAVAVAATMAVLVGGGIWLVVRGHQPGPPQISVYSDGHAIRVGPFFYCEVLNLNNCQNPQSLGELRVNDRGPVQLSVPDAIARAPWRLLQVYEDPRDTTESMFRPRTRSAVTVPTVDRHRGRLTGVVVQLWTLVRDESGELIELPHAEWSVRTVW